MDAYDDFACTLDEDETSADENVQSSTKSAETHRSPAALHLHNSMPEKEAEFRLRKAKLGSFLIRKKSQYKYQDPYNEYWVSYNVTGKLSGCINVMHKSLENCTGTQESLQEALAKLDPTGTLFRHPLRIDFLNEQKTQSKPPAPQPQIRTRLNILSCTVNSFYHGEITEKEAVFRLKNSQVGSFLLRSFQSPNKDCLSYYVSYSSISKYCYSKITHTCLDDYIRPGGSLQAAMRRLDPTGTLFVLPLHPNLSYKLERFQTWKCDQCNYKTTNMESFVRHKDEEKMLLKLTPLPMVKLIKCEKCDFETVLKAEYVSHFNKTHQQKSPDVKNPKIRLVKTKTVKKVKGNGLMRENITATAIGTETGIKRKWITE